MSIGLRQINGTRYNFTGLIYIAGGMVTALTLTSGTISATLPYFDINADPASPFFSPLYSLVAGEWQHSGLAVAFNDPLLPVGYPSYFLYSQGDLYQAAGSLTRSGLNEAAGAAVEGQSQYSPPV
jgi:hypothetical protein